MMPPPWSRRIAAFHGWHQNYYHWLLQCIPALVLARTINHSKDLVFLLPPISKWQERLLEIFQLNDVSRIPIDPNKQYCVRNLHFSTISQGCSVNHLSPLVNSIIGTRRINRRNSFDGPILYISRLDTSRRMMTNGSCSSPPPLWSV